MATVEINESEAKLSQSLDDIIKSARPGKGGNQQRRGRLGRDAAARNTGGARKRQLANNISRNTRQNRVNQARGVQNNNNQAPRRTRQRASPAATDKIWQRQQLQRQQNQRRKTSSLRTGQQRNNNFAPTSNNITNRLRDIKIRVPNRGARAAPNVQRSAPSVIRSNNNRPRVIRGRGTRGQRLTRPNSTGQRRGSYQSRQVADVRQNQSRRNLIENRRGIQSTRGSINDTFSRVSARPRGGGNNRGNNRRGRGRGRY